jgi:hypothetical protein
MGASFDRVIAALGDRIKFRREGSVTATCPAHDDRTASLSVSIGHKGTVVKCFTGCTAKEIVEALSLRLSDLFDGDTANPQRGVGASIQPTNTATAQHGCRLLEYATRKKLSVLRLQQFGVTEITYNGRPAIRIPYRSPDGQEVAVRFRVALEKGSEGDGRFV